VRRIPVPARPTVRAAVAAVTLALAGALVLGACGGDDDSGGLSGGAGGADGATLFRGAGCSDCHSTTGETKTGPPLNGIYGTEVALTNGETVTADDEYLERAIRDPKGEVVEGFRRIMPELDLSDEQVGTLVAYIRSLSDSDAPAGSAPTTAAG
jgi:cytochrome c2